MNKRQLSAFTFGILLLAASCRKTDKLHQPASTSNEVAKAAASAPAASTWQAAQWNSNKQDKFTTYNTQIKDSSITTAVIKSGLVLVYINDGSAIASLPHQQKGSNDAFWYHQLSKNTLQINVDVYAGQVNPAASQVRYFVISSERLAALQTEGKTKQSLMSLTYEDATTLLK
jgi:hypothetical protein